ncbi:MAG: hypothetical protein QNJ32_28105 [Xenococcaceae cyanobacterium MO_167.B27]|nr:hypothetical protein [Xenococcaceae cyanobacterium MO_167.B27]
MGQRDINGFRPSKNTASRDFKRILGKRFRPSNPSGRYTKKVDILLLEAIAHPQIAEIFQFVQKNSTRSIKRMIGEDFQFVRSAMVQRDNEDFQFLKISVQPTDASRAIKRLLGKGFQYSRV